MLAPELHSPIADTFRTEKGVVKVSATGKYTVVAEFPPPAAQIERMFDQVSIVSANAPGRPSPGLGPFWIAEQKPGVSLLLRRNSAYWKRDSDGRPLPRLDSIRIYMEQNRDLELLRFDRVQQILHEQAPVIYRLHPDALVSELEVRFTETLNFAEDQIGVGGQTKGLQS
jgi:peptide/nickel transport system substrate-binding protein